MQDLAAGGLPGKATGEKMVEVPTSSDGPIMKKLASEEAQVSEPENIPTATTRVHTKPLVIKSGTLTQTIVYVFHFANFFNCG